MSPWIDENYLEDEKVLKGRFLTFPEMFMVGDIGRNIHRGINCLIDIGFSGVLVGTSTDGCFVGYVIENSREESYDLDEWSKRVLGEDYNLDNIDIEADFDAYCELQNEICDLFYEKYL